MIGLDRARGFEHHQLNGGASGNAILSSTSINTTQFKSYLFDIRMFTTITVEENGSGTNNNHTGVVQGAKVTGVNSGAYGFVHSSSGTDKIVLTSIVGEFTVGEN